MLGAIIEDRYLVEEELGAGAMGHVYRARHVRCGRQVAIKVMRKEYLAVASIVERFKREASICARLHHPNVVGVLDVGATPDGQPLTVLELAPGVPLSDLIEGPLPAARVIDIISQILRGLAHAHAMGLVHRDLKPDNILVATDADGRDVARIVDFGIAIDASSAARHDHRRLTDLGTVVGTPAYMSPEQATAKPLDHRSDLFSLGVIMYELLAGTLPFSGSSVDLLLATVSLDAPSIRMRAGISVDPHLERIARKLMARRVGDRFQSAEEALAALAPQPAFVPPPPVELAVGSARMPVAEPIIEELEPEPEPVVIASPPPPRRRSFALAVGLAFAAAALVFVGGPSHGERAEAATLDLPTAAAASEMRVAVASRLDAVAFVAAPVAAPARVAARPTPTPAPAPVAIAAPAPAAPQAPASAVEVVTAHYIAVGHALATRDGSDPLWQRYRRIHLADAVATADHQREALAELSALERELPR